MAETTALNKFGVANDIHRNTPFEFDTTAEASVYLSVVTMTTVQPAGSWLIVGEGAARGLGFQDQILNPIPARPLIKRPGSASDVPTPDRAAL
jgi:hypothetical protein